MPVNHYIIDTYLHFAVGSGWRNSTNKEKTGSQAGNDKIDNCSTTINGALVCETITMLVWLRVGTRTRLINKAMSICICVDIVQLLL